MSKKTINGKIKIFYPFDKDDVIQDLKTFADLLGLVSKRKEGVVTSSLNDTTGKRENITKEEGYQSIGDQLDNLWHDIDEGKLDKTGSFYTSIKTVKDRWEKP